ncbi:MAG: hypothetical protein F4X84_03555 [Synechococcus sp. SB0662_bin_45]|nr:hypothetical protein [Synechococcus sp. SB0668_bin_13]MYE21448.1 hypothetical protein [Synechococcus sp. SB0662_bin_45]
MGRCLILEAPSPPRAKAGKPQEQTTAGVLSPHRASPSPKPVRGQVFRCSPYPELGLYYGIREGELLHISQVPRGLSCGCVCPACHGLLVAKRGRQREHHFAHGPGDSCQHAIETALHLAAKDVLARRREIVVPVVEVKFPYDKFVNYNFSHKIVLIAPEQHYQLDSVELEHRMSEIISDVLAKVAERSLLIEIRVTHKVDERKLEKI